MQRPLAGAVAALVTATALYPLDTYKVSRQIDRRVLEPRVLYTGFENEACSAFVSTGVYFACYDAVCSWRPETDPLRIAFASVAGTCTACLVRSPLSLRKRRSQMSAAGFVIPPISWRRTAVRAYALDVSRSIPKTVVKYVIYEHLFAAFQRSCGAYRAAAMAGAFAAALSNAFAIIFDIRKARLLAGSLPTGVLTRSLLPSMMQTIASNSIGHALMEAVCAL